MWLSVRSGVPWRALCVQTGYAGVGAVLGVVSSQEELCALLGTHNPSVMGTWCCAILSVTL